VATKTVTPQNDDPYGNFDPAAIRAATKSGPTWWRPKNDKHVVRILPQPLGGGRFFEVGYQHFLRGAGRTTSLFCTRLTHDQGDKCYICQQWMAFKQSEDPADQKEAEEMRPKKQYFVAIVDLEKKDQGVQVYAFGQMIMNRLLAYVQDAEYGNIFHPTSGRNLTITKESKGKERWQVEYNVIAGGKQTPVEDPKWLTEAAALLSEVVEFKSYDEQKAEFNAVMNGAASAEDAADPDTAPAPKVALPPAAAKAREMVTQTVDFSKMDAPPTVAKSKFCPNCGQAAGATNFCGNCGTDLRAQAAPAVIEGTSRVVEEDDTEDEDEDTTAYPDEDGHPVVPPTPVVEGADLRSKLRQVGKRAG
jgi:hypothetical protein